MDELKALWKGVKIKASLSRFALMFRDAVLCVYTDVPTTRKICGFKGHSAQLGTLKFLGGFGEREITLNSKEAYGNLAQMKNIVE